MTGISDVTLGQDRFRRLSLVTSHQVSLGIVMSHWVRIGSVRFSLVMSHQVRLGLVRLGLARVSNMN